MIDILTKRFDELKKSLDEIDKEYKSLKGTKMSVNLWYPRDENLDYFVRFDKPHPDNKNIVVWICNAWGHAIDGGALIEIHDSKPCRCPAVDPNLAKKSGIKLSDGSNLIIRSPENTWDKDDCISTLAECIKVLQDERQNE